MFSIQKVRNPSPEFLMTWSLVSDPSHEPPEPGRARVASPPDLFFSAQSTLTFILF
jgi:hypothetical protein